VARAGLGEGHLSLSFRIREPGGRWNGSWAVAHGGSDAWTWFAAAVMLHGIYRLSFLELWALANDSYPLAIMEIIGRGGSAADPTLMRRLEAIGTSKQGLASRRFAGPRARPRGRRW
jgi:hypothetical protein